MARTRSAHAKRGPRRGEAIAWLVLALGCGRIDYAASGDGGGESDASELDAGALDADGSDAGPIDAGTIELDAPGADARFLDAPFLDAPASDAPASDAPFLDAPGSDAPGSDAPFLDAPANDAPRDGGSSCIVPTTRPTITAALVDPTCDVITVLAGTYTESLTIDRSVEILGVGAVVIDGARAGSVIASRSPAPIVRLAGMTIRNGASLRGGGIDSASNTTLEDVIVTDNTATDRGGGIYNTGTLTLRRCRVELNTVSVTGTAAPAVHGGGIATEGGSLSLLEGTVVTANTASVSGFSNVGEANGAGIVASETEVVIDASTVTANRATVDATAGTGALVHGAGISASGGAIRIRGGSSVADNVATVIAAGGAGGRALGGGIYIAGITTMAVLQIDRSAVTGNSSEATAAGLLSRARGGAIVVLGQTDVTITDSTIAGNTARAAGTASSITADGGALTLDPDTAGPIVASLVRSTVSGNTCDATVSSAGGGIYAAVAGGTTLDLSVVESTLSDNEVAGGATTAAGGALAASWIGGTSTLAVFLDSSTITGNRVLDAAGSGGGIYTNRVVVGAMASVHLRGTILYGNTAASGPDCITTGTSRLESVAYDLLGDVTSCTLIGARTGDRVGVDPLLAPLGDNGGPTETHLIGVGGGAHESGDPAGCRDHLGAPFTVDQRGSARPVGRCDIGSVERTP